MVDKCYINYREIRKEVVIFVVLIIILIPTIFITYFYVKPKIEKVYIVSFNNAFVIPPFTATCFNTSSQVDENISISSDVINDLYIDIVEFGFNDYQDPYNATDYELAYLTQTSNSSKLNYAMKYGQYFTRLFSTADIDLVDLPTYQFLFKASPLYSLFMMKITFGGNIGNCTVTTHFYLFFDTNVQTTEDISQYTITINELTFSEWIFLIPEYTEYAYSIAIDIEQGVNSYYMFDFTFR